MSADGCTWFPWTVEIPNPWHATPQFLDSKNTVAVAVRSICLNVQDLLVLAAAMSIDVTAVAVVVRS